MQSLNKNRNQVVHIQHLNQRNKLRKLSFKERREKGEREIGAIWRTFIFGKTHTRPLLTGRGLNSCPHQVVISLFLE
jgi:hypothetical protein